MDNVSQLLLDLFGEGDTLAWWQMCARAVAVFVIAMIMLRLAGRRTFAQKTAFDICIVLLLGATLARAVVGASPFLGTVLASLVLVLLHRGVAWLAVHNASFERWIGGHPIELFSDGIVHPRALKRGLISREDLLANLRQTRQSERFDGIRRILLERNGTVTLIEDEDEPPASAQPTGAQAERVGRNDRAAPTVPRREAAKATDTGASPWLD
jgi:uncharacterized membrane protein YcaP (DUF421 family)